MDQGKLLEILKKCGPHGFARGDSAVPGATPIPAERPQRSWSPLCSTIKRCPMKVRA
jgi:hypothetical protein